MCTLPIIARQAGVAWGVGCVVACLRAAVVASSSEEKILYLKIWILDVRKYIWGFGDNL